MTLKILKDYQALSEYTADEILKQIESKPDSVICLAAGDTPRLSYQILAKKINQKKTDLSKCSIIGLDEWVGIPPDNEGSCQYFLRNEFLNQVNISPAQVHLFNAMSDDLARECWIIDEVIKVKNGLDLMVVGVGMNGHIGFNEPGVSFELYSHVIDLDDTTQSVGQKYFKKTTTIKKGITLGLKHLTESRKAILIANGSKKADVIKAVVEGQVDSQMPASIMKNHANGWILVDADAAVNLRKDSNP